MYVYISKYRYVFFIYICKICICTYIYLYIIRPSLLSCPPHPRHIRVCSSLVLSTCAYLCIGTSAHVCARVCVCTVQNCKTRWTDMCDPNTIIKLSGSLDEFPHKMTSSTRCGGSHVSGGHCMYALMCVLS